MTGKVNIDSELPVLIESGIVDEPDSKVVEDSEPEPKVEEPEVKEPIIDTLVDLLAEYTTQLRNIYECLFEIA